MGRGEMGQGRNVRGGRGLAKIRTSGKREEEEGRTNVRGKGPEEEERE